MLVGVAAALRAGWPRWARRFRPAWPFVGGRRGGGHRLRPALRGVLRPDRPGADDLDQPARPAGHPAPGRGRRRRDPARRGLRARHGQPVAGRRLALRTVRALRHRGQLRCFSAPPSWPAAGTSIRPAAGGGRAPRPGRAGARRGRLPRRGGRRGHRRGVQTSVELFDLVVRLGSNVVSFTRLAAFGLTHAALGLLVWEGTQGAVAARRDTAPSRGGARVRRRDRAGVQPGSARRGHPGAAAGVLRAVFQRSS